MGCQAHLSEGAERTIIGVIGNGRPLDHAQIERMSGVERTVPVLRPFKLASREFHPKDTIFPINGVSIGGKKIVVMAGPCAVESREQLMETAQAVKDAGAQVLRGGAFKPRTSPYSFQGMGEAGLELLAEAKRHGHADRYRGHVARTGTPRHHLCRYPADRRAQHAELCTATRGR